MSARKQFLKKKLLGLFFYLHFALLRSRFEMEDIGDPLDWRKFWRGDFSKEPVGLILFIM
jgi:hypothetical protein